MADLVQKPGFFKRLAAGLAKLTFKSFMDFILNNIVVILGIIAIAVVSILRTKYLSPENINNNLRNISVRFIIALGVSGCLITRGTDLSAGRAVGLATCITAALMQRADASNKVFPELGAMNIFVAFLIVAAIMAVIGAVNGTIVAYLKVPPFITTLGTQTIVYGIAMLFTKNLPIGTMRTDFTRIATGSLFNIKVLPFLALIALAVGLIWWILYNKTPHGKAMYAIGGNEAAANVAGINIAKSFIIIYALAGMLYGMGGFLLAAKSGGGSPGTSGVGFELDAIAACTVGGVSVSGGVGKIQGILLGVTIFELLKTAMQFMGVSPNYTYIVQGFVIVFAVALDMRKYVAKK